MFMGLVTVVLVDAILYLVIGLVHVQWSQKKGSVPISYAVALLALCCVAHFGATKTMGRAASSVEQAWLVVAASAGFGFVPIWAYVRMLTTRIGEEAQKRRVDLFPKARKLRMEGDIEGALREYLRYYERTPNSAHPLFSAAGMLEQAKEYEKAAKLFRQIMERFKPDDSAWAKAGLRLAQVVEEHLDDAETAERLRKEVERRSPKKVRDAASGDLDASVM